MHFTPQIKTENEQLTCEHSGSSSVVDETKACERNEINLNL